MTAWLQRENVDIIGGTAESQGNGLGEEPQAALPRSHSKSIMPKELHAGPLLEHLLKPIPDFSGSSGSHRGFFQHQTGDRFFMGARGGGKIEREKRKKK